MLKQKIIQAILINKYGLEPKIEENKENKQTIENKEVVDEIFEAENKQHSDDFENEISLEIGPKEPENNLNEQEIEIEKKPMEESNKMLDSSWLKGKFFINFEWIW